MSGPIPPRSRSAIGSVTLAIGEQTARLSVVGDEVRHLGTIEGREIPGSDAPVPPSPSNPPHPSYPPHASYPPPAAPPVLVAGHDLVPYVDRPQRRTAQARAEVSEALQDIRNAHRRGPKPNSRPLPRWVERLAWVLDDAVAIPGSGGRRVGIDGFITLVPGIGDAVGMGLSMVIVTAGVLAGVSWPTILRMLWNVAFEGVVSLVPFAGVVFDMAYKANDRNVRLIEADLADRAGTRRSSLGVLIALVVTGFVGFVMMIAISLLGISVMAWMLWRLLGG